MRAFQHTKVRPPPLPAGLMPRPALLAKLDAGAPSGFILLAAPAGYGKTTLLLQWAATRTEHLAWVALDEGDNDFGLVARYLLAAVSAAAQGTGEDPPGTEGRRAGPDAELDASAVSAPDAIAAYLIERLEALSEDLILVLENTHYLRDEDVWQLIGTIVNRPPHHLLLALEGRRSPKLPLSRIRGHGRVTEVRERDLAFSPAEARSFLVARLGSAGDLVDIDRIVEQTEGWPAALHLASLSLLASEDPAAAAARFTGKDRYVMGYLVDEIIGGLPGTTQERLLEMSVVGAFNASLCAAVLGVAQTEEPEVPAPLDWLEDNPLVVPVDAEGSWFRYHHLLRDLLQDRLQAAYGRKHEAELRTRAAHWLSAHGMVDEALEQARALGNYALGASFVEANHQEAIDNEHWQDLDRWLRLLPPHLLECRPGLAMVKAQSLQRQFRFAEADVELRKVESLLAGDGSEEDPAASKALEGETASLRAQSRYWQGDSQGAFDMAAKSLDLLPVGARRSRGLAYLYKAGAVELQGDLPEAIRILEDALAQDGDDQATYPTPLLVGLCNLRHMAGDLDGVERTAQYLLALSGERGLVEGRGWANSFLGRIAYERNDLERARGHLEAAIAHPLSGHLLAVKEAYYSLALLAQARGEDDAADRTVDALKRHLLSLGQSSVGAESESFRARLDLMRGERPRLDLWTAALQDEGSLVHLGVDYELPHLTFAWARITEGGDVALAEAEHLLARLDGAARRIQNVLRVVQVRVLGSLLEQARGEESAALELAGEAVDRARSGGFLRTFLDYGPEFAFLLRRLSVKRSDDAYLGRLIEADQAGPHPTGPPVVAEAITAHAEELLTNREMNILALLAERLSNKEIAQRLYISPLTVKRHTINIYGKLGAANRREAVVKATQLGLVPSLPERLPASDARSR